MIRNPFPTYFSSFLTAFYFYWAGEEKILVENALDAKKTYLAPIV